jgi:2-polyprenyl-6-hydroxyphenyl methylase/3-demethylubiquinone-9 3-methyltransferase
MFFNSRLSELSDHLLELYMERKKRINNDFYNDLHDDWETAYNHPVALLRAENKVRNPWIEETIQSHFNRRCEILDVGCGAGFLTNALAKNEHFVTGIDLSETSLETASKNDSSKNVRYLIADASSLPFQDAAFDVVCAMDVLEHVDHPEQLIRESSRVLKPGGLFFFHTFNRNWLSWLIIIKGVEWFVQNTPEQMHVYHLFIKPSELKKMCEDHQLSFVSLQGLRPCICKKSFWSLLLKKQVPKDFTFTWTRSLQTGYSGAALKSAPIF